MQVTQMRGNQDVHRIGVHLCNILKWSRARKGKQHICGPIREARKLIMKRSKVRNDGNQSRGSIKELSQEINTSYQYQFPWRGVYSFGCNKTDKVWLMLPLQPATFALRISKYGKIKAGLQSLPWCPCFFPKLLGALAPVPYLETSAEQRWWLGDGWYDNSTNWGWLFSVKSFLLLLHSCCTETGNEIEKNVKNT